MNNPDHQTEAATIGLREKIRDVARRMSCEQEHGCLGTGEMAELRRWRLGGEISPTAWRLLTSYSDQTEESRSMEETENRWLAVLAGMALMAPYPHQPGAYPGQVLAKAGYSETRFHKLLNSRDEAFFDAVNRTCRFLRAKGVAVDWIHFATFILTQDADKAEEQRRRLARSYFSHQPSDSDPTSNQSV
ncbi:MAG: type I-E CRISPR-associated protein Cse2/CasB [Magnetococcales bacterium]|nr:type I-E CRISPR-associated protein Cse2/CasB [Magnetococcales bacterium]